MVMVVANSIFVPGHRTAWLDTPDEVLLDENAERVIDRLPRDRPDVGSDTFGDFFGGRMWVRGNGFQDRDPLSGDLDTVIAKLLIDRLRFGDLVLAGVVHRINQADILD